jgi:hypothetical protein
MGYVELDCLNRSLRKIGIWNDTQFSCSPNSFSSIYFSVINNCSSAS